MARRSRFAAALPYLASAAILGLLAFPGPVRASTVIPVDLEISGTIRSGSSITVTPIYPDGFALPPDQICAYELAWGDTTSLVDRRYNETFGDIVLRGHADQGFCGQWRVTLPYSASATWIVNFNFDGGAGGYTFQPVWTQRAGWTPYLKGSNGPGASAGIAASNLPGAWMKLPATITVGDRVTAQVTPFGGYVQSAAGAHWTARPAAGGTAMADLVNHELSMTFTATVTGGIVVAYNDFAGPGRSTSAAADPRVRPRPTPSPKPAAIATGTPTPAPTPTPTPEPTATATVEPAPTLAPVASPSPIQVALAVDPTPSPVPTPRMTIEPARATARPALVPTLFALVAISLGAVALVLYKNVRRRAAPWRSDTGR
jgi:hypothetical protein